MRALFPYYLVKSKATHRQTSGREKSARLASLVLRRADTWTHNPLYVTTQFVYIKSN